jgi:hypothetical protein
MLTQDMTTVLGDPSASDWLKHTLIDAMRRDPVDAAVDAEILSQLLSRRAEAVLLGDLPPASYFLLGSLTE